MKLILASASPRRREILRNLGIEPTVVTTAVDESIDAATPREAALTLAERKARAVHKALATPTASGKVFLSSEDVILAADTMVVSPEGELLGKPCDRSEAARMIASLQGREHSVISGICVIRGDVVRTEAESTAVVFDHMSEELISLYTSLGEGDDKAGAYGIQGLASLFIEGIRGDYFNVVGLPVHCLETLLRREFDLSLLHFV